MKARLSAFEVKKMRLSLGGVTSAGHQWVPPLVAKGPANQVETGGLHYCITNGLSIVEVNGCAMVAHDHKEGGYLADPPPHTHFPSR